MRKPLFAISVLVCAALVIPGCGGTSRSNDNPFVVRRDLRRLAPAELGSSGRYKEAQRTVRVRVYADTAHRTQSPRWLQRFEQQVDLANQILIPELSVQLAVVESKPWEYESTNRDTGAALEALMAMDRGMDVDLVVGLMSAQSSLTTRMDALGRADALGRHLVMRGYDLDAERKALATETGVARGLAMNAGEFERLLTARIEHWKATLLLHELGHCLGAIHTGQGTHDVMDHAYDRKAAGFSEANAELMRAVLPVWLAPPEQRTAAAPWRALAEHLDRTPRWPGWIESEHQMMRERANQSATAASKHEQGTPRGVPAEAQAAYDRVRLLLAHKELDVALAEVSPLIEAYPAHTELRRLACMLWLEKEGPSSPGAEVQCKRIGELDATDASGELLLASGFAQAEQPARAHEILLALVDRAPSLGERQTEVFAAIFALYRAMNTVTWAEQAVARAPPAVDTKDIRSWALSTRRRYGLPPDGARFGITAEREGEYLRLVRTALNLVYGKKEAEARKLVQDGLKRFRNAPGLLGVQCDMELRAQRFAGARARCQKALAGYDEASWPRYLLGIVELRFRRNQDGIAHLEKAIAVDPDLKQAYHALHQAYGRQTSSEARDRLRTAYRERFGVTIPER